MRRGLINYLARAVLVAGAVVLVENDGVLDVLHDDVLEVDFLHVAVDRPPPCLDPHPILRPA